MKIARKILNRIATHKNYDRESLIVQIKDYDIISFDIYDTLIRRTVFCIEDVFGRVVEKYNSEEGSNVDVCDFIKTRVDSARKAIDELKGRTEITIEEIYDNFPEEYSESLNAFIQFEEDVEICNCQRNLEIGAVFDWCIENGKKVIICSDMYLKRSTIEQILTRCGYTGYYKLYLSSEIGYKKEDGGLYKAIKEDIGDSKKRIVHIGDNLYSDYLMAYWNGIAGIHISPTPWNTDFLQSRRIPMRHRDLWNKIRLIISQNKTNGCGLEYAYGYEILGPILYGFCQWIDADARKNGISTLYFLSRDGGIIRDAYNTLYEGNEIDNVYLYASRRALFVPQIWMDNTVENFTAQFRYNVRWSLERFCDWMDLDYNTVKRYWLDSGLQLEESLATGELQSNAKFIEFYEKVKVLIAENSKKEFDTYLHYLESVGFSGNIAIVDIGWKGRMQKNLNEIMTKAGIPVNIVGYYIGLYDKVTDSLNMNSFISNALDVVYSVGEIFEYLFTSAQEGSTKKIIENETGFTPVLFDYEYEGKKEKSVLSLIQKGALDFIKDAKKYWPSIEVSGDIAIDGVRISGAYPSTKMISLFENISFGDDGYSMIMYKGIGKYIKSVKVLIEDWSNSGWHVGFAKKLIKIPFPYYLLCRALKKGSRK